MVSTQAFSPDYAIPPGEILGEHLEHLGMTQRDLAARTGLTPKTINEIIQGKAAITADTAVKLERVVGRPAHFWQNLESQFQEARARAQERAQLDTALAWRDRMPVRELRRRGWLEPAADASGDVEALLRFFGVGSVVAWARLWEAADVAWRRSNCFTSHPEAIAAWLRQGEREGLALACAPFNKAGFRAVLEQARALTCEPPELALPRVRDACATVGVAVVCVPALPKTSVSGATRWLAPDKALIQLSLRFGTDDQLWFTFFHEAGHVLLHGKREAFLDEPASSDDAREQEANRFAADLLIPPAAWRRLRVGGKPTLAGIETFAASIGIAPGIVVGRLQRDGVLPYKVGNRLKRRLRLS